MIAAGMAVTVLNGPTLAEDTDFAITDYIPERFEDFRWRLDGGLNLSGESADGDYRYDVFNPFYYQLTERNSSMLVTDLATEIGYDYTTVQNFFSIVGQFGTGYRGSGSDAQRYYIYFDEALRESTEDNEGSSRSYEVSSAITTEAGQYLWGDFFLSARLQPRILYESTPRDNSYHEGTDLNITSGTVWSDRTKWSGAGESDGSHYAIVAALLTGWGRVYDGRFASTAMYMVEELRANGALLREPTRDEMVRLSEIVYRNRLIHAVDERILRIETFDEILGYLGEVGVIESAGRYDHLLVEDVWDYFPRTERRFGMKVSGGAGVTYAYNKSVGTLDGESERLYITYPESDPASVDTIVYDDYSSHRYSYSRFRVRQIYLTGELAYYKPLARKWQLDVLVEIKALVDGFEKENGIQEYVSDESDGALDYRSTMSTDWNIDSEWLLNPSADLTYIYDSRTSLTFHASYLYNRQDWSEDATNDYSGVVSSSRGHTRVWSAHLGGALEYRLSIPTTLSVGADYRYLSRDNTADERETLRDDGEYSLSVSVVHHLY